MSKNIFLVKNASSDKKSETKLISKNPNVLCSGEEKPLMEASCQDGPFVSVLDKRLLFTRLASSNLSLFESVVFSIIQMLLVMSGIETNPGPTNPANLQCCNAVQHFNRVKKAITGAQKIFASKLSADIITRKVIEVDETGKLTIYYEGF